MSSQADVQLALKYAPGTYMSTSLFFFFHSFIFYCLLDGFSLIVKYDSSAIANAWLAACCCSRKLVKSPFRENRCYFYQPVHGTCMSSLGLITHAEKRITLSPLLLDSVDRDRVCVLCLPQELDIVLLHPVKNFLCFKKTANAEQETRKG